MPVQTVLVDADVLFSGTLRGWIFNLAYGDHGRAFQPVVTEDIIAETVARIRDEHPRLDGGVTSSIARHLRNILHVQEEFDASIPFPGADEGDIHVHAATVACGAGYLLTRDSGFHKVSSDIWGYEVYAPDDFFLLVNEQSHQRMLEATRQQMLHNKKRREDGKEPYDLVLSLRKQCCPRFAEVIDGHLRVLSPEARLTGIRRARCRLE